MVGKKMLLRGRKRKRKAFFPPFPERNAVRLMKPSFFPFPPSQKEGRRGSFGGASHRYRVGADSGSLRTSAWVRDSTRSQVLEFLYSTNS